MWNRIELKAAAKQRFHSNYWPSVVVAVILSITLGTFSSRTLINNINSWITFNTFKCFCI